MMLAMFTIQEVWTMGSRKVMSCQSFHSKAQS